MNTIEAEISEYKWWFKGRTPEGNTCRFEGRVSAKNSMEASEKIDKWMRKEHPEMKWMQGRDTEGEGNYKGVTFGPTVQKLKGKRKK